ncbi:MAG: PD40 domain-containing protein [Anaerolineales bacterium]|nr:PD40 domain-containing protein [Anaerolineales bacterium]
MSTVSLNCNFISSLGNKVGSVAPKEPIRQEETTNSSGQVTFRDPSTKEKVTVTVLEEGKALEGANVIYLHGQTSTFEAYFIRDERGLLAVRYFLHNSDHVIDVSDITIEVIQGEIRPLNKEEAGAALGYLNDMKLVSSNTYIDTISDAEKAESTLRILEGLNAKSNISSVLLIVGVLSGGTISVFSVALNLSSTLAIGYAIDWVKSSIDPNLRWDLYHSYDATNGYENYVYVLTQSPMMQKPTINFDKDGTISASILANDPMRYPEVSSQMAGLPDYTIFEGPTVNSDLTYYYDLLKKGQNTSVSQGVLDHKSACIGDRCTETMINFGILPPGEYNLHCYAKDEVGNVSSPIVETFVVWGTNPPITGTKEPQISGSAQFPSENIVFPSINRASTTGQDLWLIDPNNHAKLTRLTREDAIFHKPLWSPDHTRITFTRREPGRDEESLYVINADGSGLKQVSSAHARVTAGFWSLDDDKIYMVTSEMDSSCQFSWIKADGSVTQAENPVSGAGNSVCSVDASPDRSQIVFRGYGGSQTIYVADLVDNGIHIESAQTLVATDAILGSRENTQPAWSADGKRIAFVADEGDYLTNIYTINSDGSNLQKVTYFTNAWVTTPRWSNDSLWLAVHVGFTDTSPQYSDIYLVPSDGSFSVVTNLTDDSIQDGGPDW